eukprot:2236577-Prymnesium_polylepis.1
MEPLRARSVPPLVPPAFIDRGDEHDPRRYIHGLAARTGPGGVVVGRHAFPTWAERCHRIRREPGLELGRVGGCLCAIAYRCSRG